MKEVERLEALLGIDIVSLNADAMTKSTSVVAVLKTLMTACYVVIAMMNGRRKDEVCGSRIGLHEGSLKTVSEELKLFECEFYIEKTLGDYAPFFINEITRDALAVLKRLSRFVWEFETAARPKDQKLFVIPTIGKVTKPGFYRYGKAECKHLASLALGPEGRLPRSHMYRRAYALVFQYRYENADLLALSNQLVHRDLGMTGHYVLEPGSREMVERAEMHWPMPKDQLRDAQVAHAKALAREVESVSQERLQEIVKSVLSGEAKYSGGYAKLVSRFHAALGKYIEYGTLGAAGQSARLTQALLDRGHRPVPYPHGDCNAGTPRPNARCFDSKSGGLQRELASAHTCATCAFHRCSHTHVDSLVREAQRMRAELAGCATHSVRRVNLERDLSNLEKAIDLHKSRLGME